jgi:membrane protease YdiL (CAAX protease family)
MVIMSKKQSSNMSILKKIYLSTALLAWVTFGFFAVQFLLMGVIWAVRESWSIFGWHPIEIDNTILSTILSAIIYSLSLLAVILVPARLLKIETTRQEMGLRQKWPSLRDIGLAPWALIASFILTAVGFFIASVVFGEGFNAMQEQAVMFDKGSHHSYFSLLMIFLTIVVIAPVAEELLIRGYLYGKLRVHSSAFVTILLTSLLFGALHLGFGEIKDLQWNVAIGTFAMAVFMGWLREYTGSVWSGIIVHVIKNFIAYLFLFALPSYLSITF